MDPMRGGSWEWDFIDMMKTEEAAVNWAEGRNMIYQIA